MRNCVVLLLLLGFTSSPLSSSQSCSLPVFSPSLLVVKFGDPAFASCSVCDDGSCDSELRLEEPLSSSFCNGSSCVWNVSRVPLWSLLLICYIFDSSCQQSSLKVTVYQPPERVSLRFGQHPLLEGELYPLHCEVEAVAPAELLTVRFYRNHKELGSRSGQSTLKSPVNQSLSLDYRLSREDHRALFYCEASLELGPGGPQPGPLLRSQNITADVHYAPRSAVSEPEFLTIVQGQTVELDCSSDGNPDPQYSWSGPSLSEPLSGSSVFTVGSASSQHQGQYFCNASNSRGTVQRVFTVTVTVNYMPVLVVVLLAALILIAVISYLFHRHRDHYSLRDLLCLHNHNAVLTTA